MGCCAVFWICRRCDRGHAYCSDQCRAASRREQRRRARQRHERSPEGRLDHRDRQREYRARVRVPDQSSIRVAERPTLRPPEAADLMQEAFSPPAEVANELVEWLPRPRRAVVCVLCGAPVRWVEAFGRSG